MDLETIHIAILMNFKHFVRHKQTHIDLVCVKHYVKSVQQKCPTNWSIQKLKIEEFKDFQTTSL